MRWFVLVSQAHSSMYRYAIALFLYAFLPRLAVGQPVIAFRNASLEGEPQANTAPHDWYYCNFPGDSPPDLHPMGLYRVRLPAADGKTYVGMVCRDNGSFESIGQHLPTPLEAGSCYLWQGRVARTPRYQAISRSTLRADDFSAPVRLVFYGGDVACADEHLLGWTDSIAYADWRTQEVVLRVPVTSEHLRSGVVPFDSSAANGHVLLDELDPLVPCSCDSGVPQQDITILSAVEQPDWSAITTALERHLRFPRTGITAFRHEQRTRQGLAVLARTVAYLQRTDRRLDIGILLTDRQAFRTVRTQLQYRLQELNLTDNRLRFKKLSHPPRGQWVGAAGNSILYLRPR